jgi:hypothetical protein
MSAQIMSPVAKTAHTCRPLVATVEAARPVSAVVWGIADGEPGIFDAASDHIFSPVERL